MRSCLPKIFKYCAVILIYLFVVNSSFAEGKNKFSLKLADAVQLKEEAVNKEAVEVKTEIPEPNSDAGKTRDPFSPVSGDIMKKIVDRNDGTSTVTDSTVNPLTTAKINTIKVVGVILSEKKKVAAVKAINGLTYVIEEGVEIGSDGGKVSEIKYEGIVVSSDSGKVLIPVSNKLEVKVDKKD